MSSMRFSKAYKIKVPQSSLDFYDCRMDVDTELFIDPVLVECYWQRVYRRIKTFFDLVYNEVIQGHYTQAKQLIVFPEVKEVCLGYTEWGVEGSGLGEELDTAVFDLLVEKIEIASYYPRPEVFTWLIYGFDRDRLSDLVVNVIKEDLIEFTERQCNALGVPMRNSLVKHIFNFTTNSWEDRYVDLPWNHAYSGRQGIGVLLAPKEILSDGSLFYSGRRLRRMFEKSIMKRKRKEMKAEIGKAADDKKIYVKKEEIIAEAVKNLDSIERALREIDEELKKEGCPSPYDFKKDPKEYLKDK